MVKLATITVLLAIMDARRLFYEQIDVKTMFFHAYLEDEIYMLQPRRFEVSSKGHFVSKIIRRLYGFKQAPKQWYNKFDTFIVSKGL